MVLVRLRSVPFLATAAQPFGGDAGSPARLSLASLSEQSCSDLRHQRLAGILAETEVLLVFELFGCEVFVSEAFVLHVLDDEFHLVYRVISADVVPCCELFRIAGQVFFAEVMVCAVDAAFEQSPKRFHSICMGLAGHILSSRMRYRCVVVEPCG